MVSYFIIPNPLHHWGRTKALFAVLKCAHHYSQFYPHTSVMCRHEGTVWCVNAHRNHMHSQFGMDPKAAHKGIKSYMRTYTKRGSACLHCSATFSPSLFSSFASNDAAGLIETRNTLLSVVRNAKNCGPIWTSTTSAPAGDVRNRTYTCDSTTQYCL